MAFVGSTLRHGEDSKEVKRGLVEEQEKKRGQGKEREKEETIDINAC